jgi:fatty acid desaturase
MKKWFMKFEGPTFALAAVIYSCWLALVWFHEAIPWWLLWPAATYVTAWHFNFQHEIVHGWRSIPSWLRVAIAYPPLSLWFPLDIYVRNHSIHHRNQRLTYPGQDTETFYHKGEDWAGYSRAWRWIYMANQTLIGRLLLGPWLRWRKLVMIDIGKMFRGDLSDLSIWIRHSIAVAVLLWFVLNVAGMPFWQFFLFFTLSGMMLGMVRPFLEHRWGEKPFERVAVIESNWVFGLLFLWNNIHIVHHLHPTMPWYEIPSFYKRNRARMLELNGNFVYRGYYELARNYLLTPTFRPVHPDA